MPTMYASEAAKIMGLPEFLIRDFVSYEFNGRKLIANLVENESLAFDQSEVLSFLEHLDSQWPDTDRTEPPAFVQRYLIFEARGKCALCQEAKKNYDWAHIEKWSSSRSHSPHNLLRLCVDCHRSHGENTKLLRGLKEELLRHNNLVPLEMLYDCDNEVVPGSAVYCKNGRAYLALATLERDKLATGFVGSKIGPTRCTVQRVGVISCFINLVAGEEYLLSTLHPGVIVTKADYDQEINGQHERSLQIIGFAESSIHLVIRFIGDLTLKPGVKLAEKRD